MDHCAVCGEPIDAYNPPFVSRYQGQEYRLCSEECQEEFELDPQAYSELPLA